MREIEDAEDIARLVDSPLRGDAPLLSYVLLDLVHPRSRYQLHRLALLNSAAQAAPGDDTGGLSCAA